MSGADAQDLGSEGTSAKATAVSAHGSSRKAHVLRCGSPTNAKLLRARRAILGAQNGVLLY